MLTILSLRSLDVFGIAIALWLAYRVLHVARERAKTTKLPGPITKNWFFGVSKDVFDFDNGELFENLAKEFGSVYQVPGPLGIRRLVLLDPKAVAHFYAKILTYVKNDFTRLSIQNLVSAMF